MSGYIECEKEIKHAYTNLSSSKMEDFRKVSMLLFAGVLSAVDSDIYGGRFIPEHGPGATADRLFGNSKWQCSQWTSRLETIFPHWENLFSNECLSFDEHKSVDLLEPGAEQPVRVVSVPKTLKAPRIIAIEPSYMMFMQKAVYNSIVENLRKDDILREFICWDSQVPNQELAALGSSSGELATLDLSEASDRVSNQHVRALLNRFPHLFEAVDATRSRKADVPGHGVIRLSKFASMGSALCFPMESMVFLTVIFLGIQEELNRPLTKNDFQSFVGSVRVYGDDIIIPVEFMQCVIRSLETFGFKVNGDKSFGLGKFRESCGRDYYDGVDVSITKIRRMLPDSRTAVQEVVSAVSLRNQLYLAGMWKSAFWLDTYLEALKVPLPYVLSTSPVLGRQSYLGLEAPIRTCPSLHRPLVRGYVVTPVLPVSKLDGPDALLKCLTLLEQRKDGDCQVSGVDHLERAGRPVAVNAKLRWGTPA